ncbi:MAG: NAD-dependent epimerase/dehydratase family protein [Chlorobi bacterium]|nr:NAD-dependent epimerase/dehydratase family protein [Chlorobiota bacterium]MCI0716082.1 NAD-dependent epimerase/dehydratase family protein [Chlorobiota bacterium]
MKILVTGGSGFIGSHVVDVLLTSGHEVLIYDLEEPRYKQNCGFVKANVNDLDKLTSTSKNFDFIYHMAAEANVNRFYQNPLHSNYNTANSTLSVLECARKNNISRVMLSSTEWIYGSIEGDENQSITEETPYAQNPDHLYTSSKISAELFCKNYKTLYDVNFTIMRYGIPFGERARPETVTPIFISRILKNEEITIHGDGSQTRQFVYVRDLAEGNAACLKPEAENQIFNINGREKISVLQIVKTLEEIIGKKAKIKFIEDRRGNYKGRFISSEKAEKLLGWKPKYSYREAMERYVKNFINWNS